MSLETEDEPWLSSHISCPRLRWALKTDTRHLKRPRGYLLSLICKHLDSVLACSIRPPSNFIKSVDNNELYYLSCSAKGGFCYPYNSLALNKDKWTQRLAGFGWWYTGADDKCVSQPSWGVTLVFDLQCPLETITYVCRNWKATADYY